MPAWAVPVGGVASRVVPSGSVVGAAEPWAVPGGVVPAPAGPVPVVASRLVLVWAVAAPAVV
ncbi:hypothetical protein [Streptomyces subrutilus]|uniref:hypothetical protein n=1 Tax=Streptomyces subrutilus TaxID=36818 RepID=UPI0033E0502B